MFAERVLKNDIRDDMCITPHYTRSLDAAWEGVTKLNLYNVLFEDRPTHPAITEVFLNYADGGGEYRSYGDHPAEALVLACLRAVGCTEDELA